MLNISLLFMIAILGCSMTMQAECVVEYGYDVVKTNRVYRDIFTFINAPTL